MNSKKMSIIWLSWTIVISVMLVVFIYQLYFQKHFKAQFLISEIETLQIDSSKTFQYSFDTTQTYYEFWSGGKYKISVECRKAKPFVSAERQQVFVTDINGNLLMSYDTKYHYLTLNCWESDYIRLMNYLNIQHR